MILLNFLKKSESGTHVRDHKEGWALNNWCFWTVMPERTLESLGLQDQTRRSTLNIHCKDWCSHWSSSTLATWCEQPAHWKRPWCWERLRARGEVDDRRLRWLDGITDFNGHEFEQSPGDGEEQGSLVCCSPWGWTWLNNNKTIKLKFSKQSSSSWTCSSSDFLSDSSEIFTSYW